MKVSTRENISEIGTKFLSADRMSYLKGMIGDLNEVDETARLHGQGGVPSGRRGRGGQGQDGRRHAPVA